MTPSPISPELATAIEAERALDRAFLRHAERLAARQSGVCWSGPPVPLPPQRSAEAIERAARARLERQQTWLTLDTTTWLRAMIDLQARALELHGLAERGRETWSRGLPGELEGAETLRRQMRSQIPEIRNALIQARRALQALHRNAQDR